MMARYWYLCPAVSPVIVFNTATLVKPEIVLLPELSQVLDDASLYWK
jgi:hypothetical protein